MIPEAYNCHGTFRPVSTPPEKLMQEYYASVGRGANFLQAMVPDKRGLIDDDRVKALAEFGAEVRRRFSSPIARTDSSKGWLEPGVLEIDLGGVRRSRMSSSKKRLPRGSTFSSTRWTSSQTERGRRLPKGNPLAESESSGSSRRSRPKRSASASYRPMRSQASAP